MGVRYLCPNCHTTLDGRPILAFRRPPAQLECSSCRTVVRASFTYRLFWCYWLAVTALFVPIFVWALSGDLDKLGKLETWLIAGFTGIWGSVVLAMLLALPLTFILKPKPPRPTA
jgi:hypothetical protein